MTLRKRQDFDRHIEDYSQSQVDGKTALERFYDDVCRDAAWERLHDDICQDAKREGMTDMDALIAWRMGLEAYKAARKLGARWPHDPA